MIWIFYGCALLLSVVVFLLLEWRDSRRIYRLTEHAFEKIEREHCAYCDSTDIRGGRCFEHQDRPPLGTNPWTPPRSEECGKRK